MKIKDAIAALQKLPPDAELFTHSPAFHYSDDEHGPCYAPVPIIAFYERIPGHVQICTTEKK